MELTLNEALSHLNTLKRSYHEEHGKYQELVKDKAKKEEAVKVAVSERDALEMKKLLVNEAAIEARNQARDVLQDMGTTALKAIMGDQMSLRIDLKEQGRQQWVAEFITVDSDNEKEGDVVETDPAEEDGGGPADVVALASQTSMLQLTGEFNKAPMFLDEPSKYVSAGHSEQVAQFLTEVSGYFGRQMIMSTHDSYLANVGVNTYYFKKIKGSSRASKVQF